MDGFKCPKGHETTERDVGLKFSRRNNKHYQYCKICDKEYRGRNSVRIAIRAKANREKNKEQMREYLANYRAANREKWIKYAVKWNATNKERRREICKKYTSTDRWRALHVNTQAKRRARVKTKCPNVSAAVDALRNDPCSYCGGEGGHIDHIVPIKNGGQHCAGNITSACKSCNSAKGAKSVVEFLLWRSRHF